MKEHQPRFPSRIPIRVTTPFKAAVERAAEQHEISVSHYLRQAAKLALRKDGISIERNT